MERAGRVLTKLKPDAIDNGVIACRVWPRAVGKLLARRTRAVSLAGTRLIVEVEDRVWQKQLIPMTGQITRRLEALVGPGVVTDLEFRIAVFRMPAARETVLPLFDQNPDLPADPVFRYVYLIDRRKRQTVNGRSA